MYEAFLIVHSRKGECRGYNKQRRNVRRSEIPTVGPKPKTQGHRGKEGERGGGIPKRLDLP